MAMLEAAAGAGVAKASRAAGAKTARSRVKGNGLRKDPYAGGSQMAVPFPTSTPEPVASPAETPAPTAAAAGEDEDQGDDAGQPGRAPAKASGPGWSWTPPQRMVRVAGSGTGALLGWLAWIWVGLPLIKRGPAGVAGMLRAKFTNQSLDGSYLP